MTVEYKGLQLEEKTKDKWLVHCGGYLLYAICGNLEQVKEKIDKYNAEQTK